MRFEIFFSPIQTSLLKLKKSPKSPESPKKSRKTVSGGQNPRTTPHMAYVGLGKKGITMTAEGVAPQVHHRIESK